MPRRVPRRSWSCTDGIAFSTRSARPPGILAGSQVDPPDSLAARAGPWSTSFGRWVRGFTVTQLVRRLGLAGQGVTRHAVHAWVSGRAVPRYEKAATIVALSGGTLTLTDVYSQREQIHTGGQHDGTHEGTPAPARR